VINDGSLKRREYWVFGLRVRSDLKLPELIPVEGDSEPDVRVELGAITEQGSGDGLVALNGALLLTVAEVGRFLIQDGARIVVDADADVDEQNIRLFLLGSAFGALLHQRGLLPLHANAIEIGGKTFAFMGASGSGKSTLAAWFHDRDHRVIADDVCVVRSTADRRAYVSPGQQRLRLWKEALEATGRDSRDYRRSFSGRKGIDKFDLPFEPKKPGAEDCELAGIYVLSNTDRFSIERLEGLPAAEAVFSHTYRGQFLRETRSHKLHWERAIALVQRVPIFRIDRQRDLSLLERDGLKILDHAATILAGNSSLGLESSVPPQR
jgi:hypothetical protein